MADGSGGIGSSASARMSLRAPGLLTVACLLVGVVGSLALLRALPYSTSFIIPASEVEASTRPSARFSLGDLSWDLETFKAAPSLQRFRDVFEPSCGRFQGLDAARCVVDLIKARSPNGAPLHEFVDERFNPVATLDEHLAGQPGHCTSRSFMTATALLAMGKPARVIQLLPVKFDGHNVIELWDEDRGGWLVFDPHYDSSLLRGEAFVSASDLTRLTGGLRWRRPNDAAPDANVFAGATVSFPEPWLYTRVGPRVSRWPFRGVFVSVGRTQFLFGPAQKLALLAVFGFALGAVVAFWRWLRHVHLHDAAAALPDR
ncbi:MAG: hypothetical protein ACO1OB_30500 [Archangium sp.]